MPKGSMEHSFGLYPQDGARMAYIKLTMEQSDNTLLWTEFAHFLAEVDFDATNANKIDLTA